MTILLRSAVVAFPVRRSAVPVRGDSLPSPLGFVSLRGVLGLTCGAFALRAVPAAMETEQRAERQTLSAVAADRPCRDRLGRHFGQTISRALRGWSVRNHPTRSAVAAFTGMPLYVVQGHDTSQSLVIAGLAVELLPLTRSFYSNTVAQSCAGAAGRLCPAITQAYRRTTTMTFQETIYGRELAAIGRATRLRQGKEVCRVVGELYASHLPLFAALRYAKDAGLITTGEYADAETWRAEHWTENISTDRYRRMRLGQEIISEGGRV